ncbi:MAG: recombinase RecA [Clostridiales bacterium]|jgi:recombination protein RecA|nr:recombinase RecA [Clostridiales bacterium]
MSQEVKKDEDVKQKKSRKKSKDEAATLNQEEDPRQIALQIAIDKIQKSFGKGSIMKLGEKSMDNVPVVPSGSLSLDVALGVGGLPKGRIIEIYGPEASGKTTVALHAVAEAQKLGGIAAYIDAEHALDPVYARNLGVNIDDLYISQPDDGEQALDIADQMVRSGAVDIIVVDSVAALVPRAEIEGAMGASHMGVQARLMSQALRKLTGFTSKTNCIVIFINQLRDKIGGYGVAETTTGGKALKFYATVRLDIRRVDSIKQGNDFIGNRTRVKVIKNKVAPPFKQCEFDIMYGQGISREGDVLDLASALDVVQKSGTWFSYNEVRMGQGRENAKAFLRQNPDVCREIENAARKHYGFRELDAMTAPENYIQPGDLSIEPDVTEEDLLIEELVSDMDEVYEEA